MDNRRDKHGSASSSKKTNRKDEQQFASMMQLTRHYPFQQPWQQQQQRQYNNQLYQRNYNNFYQPAGQQQQYSQPEYHGSFPRVRTKDIACLFCKHHFYIGKDLKGSNSPLLLPCGHATCSNCEISYPKRPCPLCPDEYTNPTKRERLLHNAYVVGLIHVLKSAPVHIDDPDISFQIPKKGLTNQVYDQGICYECGLIAYYSCRDCKAFFCVPCFKKIHGRALQNHETILLNKNSIDLSLSNSCPNHEDEACEYYCEDCDMECCSHCVIKEHQGHNTKSHDDRNQDLLPDFLDACKKLKETKFYTLKTLKNFQSNASYDDAIKKSEVLENQITQHFIHLHGYLQNLEQKLKSELVAYRESIERNVEECENGLSNLAEKLKTACAIFTNAEKNNKKINIKKYTKKILELADSPCHFVGMTTSGEELSMDLDDSTYDNLRQHLQLKLPEIPKPRLVMTDELPEDYELEPIPEADITNASFKATSKKDTSSAGTSLVNQSVDVEDEEDVVVERQPVSCLVTEQATECVRITHIINPADFYVLRESDRQELEILEGMIADYTENKCPGIPDVVNLNQIYIVKYLETNKWYRGRVVRLKEGHEEATGYLLYDVFYVDYGRTDVGVTIDRIRNTMPNFNYFNGMALHCNLREMGPVEDEWHDDIIDKFRQMVAEETFIMKILKSDQQVQTVELYKQKNNPNNISLHDWLVDTKKAHAITSYKLKRMNPLSTRHFYYEDLPLEKTSYVHVCHIESPLCIYIYKVKSTDVAEKLNVFNTEFDQYAVSTDRTIREPELGNAVAVRTSSNRYQRGLVSKINSQEKKAFVFLVDYGQTVTANYQAIHHLPQRFCIFNAQAIKVSILDITPADGDKWSIDCISYLKKKLEDRASIKVIPYEKVDDTYNVVMYVKDTNIGSNLVAKKFALSTGDRSKNPTLNKVVPSSKKRKKSKALKLEMNLPAPNGTSVPRRRTAEDSDPFKTRVMISKVISPDLIYTSLSSNVAKFEEMNRRMQLFYETHHSEWERELHLNSTYCCYSAKDKQYCRAQFVGYNENDPALVKMLLIDMAEIEDDIPLEAVQPLTSEFFQPSQNVFKIKLAGIRPCGGTNAWTSTSCEKLKDIISDTGDSKYYVTLVGSCDEDKVFPVSLAIRRSVLTTGPLEPVRKETIIVARRLIDDGVALPIKGFFDKDKKEPAVELQKKLRLHSTENLDDSLEKKKTTAVSVSTPSSDVEVNQEIVEDKIREKDPNKVTAEAAKDDDNDDFNDSTAIPKYADWLPPAYLRDDSFNAIITYVDNDCDVYFYPDTKEYNETRDHIANTLKEYSKKAIQKQDLTWEEGDLCIAKFHATNCWCRGKVTEVVNNQTVKVLFVDWGNVEDCSIGTLKKRIVLEEIPIQVMRASIEGLSSNGYRWETHDLDVIHRTLVVQPCQIRVIEKPPQPWKVAIWVTKGSSFVTLPWYIKNMTQVDCDTDVSKYHEIGINVPSEPTNLTTKVDDSSIKDNNTNGIVICVDNNDDGSGPSSHELSKSSDDGNNEYGTPDSMMHECDESESTTLRYEEQFVDVTAQMELMQLSIINESQESDKSSSTPSLESACSNDRKMKVFSPFGEQNRMSPENNGMEFKNSFFDEEPMISGNSVLYNASSNALEFDVMSVKTEALNQYDDDHELISSTPLNASFTSVMNDDYSRKMIDFQRFNVKCFEIGLGQAFSEIHMSGYLRNSSNRDLKQWIDQCYQIHECIQSCVEEQEIFVPQPGDYCIAQYDDGMWYRARATQRTVTNDVSGTVVEFMDYGNRMSISDDENCIRTIRQEWLDVPWMGFSFKLFNVKVAPGRDKEARESINEVLGQSDRYWVHIKRYDPEIELELFSSKKNKRLVYASLIEGNIFEKIDPKL
ncbi:RING finger protein 17 [Copidosoma floridanum]|uniref:RING finger protein 17 n=1 Tax=Copidosoma floridanum TaxID=29053 RepID=UPI0006C9BA6A|nr:RING finger protein 17 [Copidosoma floridanum]